MKWVKRTEKYPVIASNHRLVTTNILFNITKAEEENEYSKIATYKLKDRENNNKFQNETDEEFTNKTNTKTDGEWRTGGRNLEKHE